MIRAKLLCGVLGLCLVSSAAAQFNVPATTVQLPTFGIAVDADGVLATKVVRDLGGRRRAELRRAALAGLPGEVRKAAPIRFVSLAGLDAELQRLAAIGEPPPPVLTRLAGLTRIQFAFCLPDEGDIVIAGPAEGWVEGLAGHPVGLESGRPVLLLEDLAAALRVFPKDLGRARPFVGCTIDPNPKSLQALTEFQRTIPRAVANNQRQRVSAYVARGTTQALGDANIRVFGVSPRTHFASVLVEADYCMKRIGIGLEPPPTKMVTFVDALRTAPKSMLQRWWFTPQYDALLVDPDGLSVELVGQGVQLSSEDKIIDQQGRLHNTGRPPGRSTQLYAQSFTAKYAEIAAARPVYGQLRNAVDLSIMAAFICREDWYARSGFTPIALVDEKLLAIETYHPPQRVPCPVNVVWKGSRMLALAGGGVQWLPDEGASPALRQAKEQEAPAKRPADLWWWDK